MPFGTVPLNDGKKIPAIAFGTGSIYKHTDVTQLVNQALETGFSHIDTAAFYDTEQYVGNAIHESGLARSGLYITTKYGLGDVREGIETSLKKLGLAFVDLYLIHQPQVIPDLDAAWAQFEVIQKDGLAKSIGVSNFTLAQLQALVKNARALLAWSAQHGIVTEAYSSLSSITKFPGGPVDVPVAAAAARLGISPTQVLLSWVRAKGAVIVTSVPSPQTFLRNLTQLKYDRTSSSKARLEEYLAVADLPPLSDAEIAAIEAAGANGPPGILSCIRGRGLTPNVKSALAGVLLLVWALFFFRLSLASCRM
ncbi:NADP-dependent oxidoreductase domain-containing protein [Mycena belliarum]|uniref:NADP-dependent oxidoreductase domain-containing protein n=1 Tax=Mycena belliarum TaxID=1033014 RepID=A0AAD6U7Q5_9AGAR|nr:NADP-dependent oxidoreductase domain-containing protein [Mycena belliae]